MLNNYINYEIYVTMGYMKISNVIIFFRNSLKPLLMLFSAVNDIFHRCKFRTIEIPYSNIKGEIWIQQCSCGKKKQVLFDSENNCRRIKPI